MHSSLNVAFERHSALLKPFIIAFRAEAQYPELLSLASFGSSVSFEEVICNTGVLQISYLQI